MTGVERNRRRREEEASRLWLTLRGFPLPGRLLLLLLLLLIIRRPLLCQTHPRHLPRRRFLPLRQGRPRWCRRLGEAEAGAEEAAEGRDKSMQSEGGRGLSEARIWEETTTEGHFPNSTDLVGGVSCTICIIDEAQKMDG